MPLVDLIFIPVLSIQHDYDGVVAVITVFLHAVSQFIPFPLSLLKREFLVLMMGAVWLYSGLLVLFEPERSKPFWIDEVDFR